MTDTGFLATARRELRRLTSRRIYFCTMIFVPLAVTLFFVSLLGEGLPLKIPSAVVDLDHSTMSRAVTRSLNSTELIDVTQKLESYTDAMESVRRGEIFGFFIIPSNFEADALGGRTPTLEYFSNMTFFVPGTLAYKGFKTVAVGTAGTMVRTTLVSAGADPENVGALIQPLNLDVHPVGNPWTNYSIYLSPSFCAGLLALMIMLVTCFAITTEIKYGTSAEWLATARGRMSVALAGKLLPHFVIWWVVTMCVLSILFGFCHFPLNGSLVALLVAATMFVVASLAMAVIFCCIVPNPRLSLIMSALIGILSFSLAAFSFPVQSMYGFIAILSYLLPVRYFFLIYCNVALNGAEVWYSRFYYLALAIFPLVACLGLSRLRKACLNPVYVP